MSPQDSIDQGRAVVLHKPKPDVYTVLLGIALAAILIAISILAWEYWGRYNGDHKASSATAQLRQEMPAAMIACLGDLHADS